MATVYEMLHNVRWFMTTFEQWKQSACADKQIDEINMFTY